MSLRAHDLLWGLDAPADAPLWVQAVLEQGLPVVVRREVLAADWVAVGVRGTGREQRYATHMARSAIVRRVSPEQLIAVPGQRDLPALRALEYVRPVLQAQGLVWGVAGGAGYELATGVAALHEGSDLDLIMRTPVPVSRQWAAHLVSALDAAPCRIDVQLQLPAGGLALREWAGSARQVLLKSEHGAQLLSDPWQSMEACA